VRAITRQGLVMSWEQVRNPGGPVPVLVPERTWAAFEPVLVQALEARP
jgi:hypothetical protein